jgi:predicted Zn-dependent peptidase
MDPDPPPVLVTINGRRVLLQKNDYKILTVSVVVSSGFIVETEATSGINHLLEHVLTEAWAKCQNVSCSRYWDEKGVTMNANTDDSSLQFFTKGLPEDMESMVRYICSIVDHPKFSQQVMTNEKKAVISELTSYGNDPISSVENEFNRLFFTQGLRYKDDWKMQIRNLKHLRLSDLKAAYERFFNPANMVYSVIGDFDPRAVARIFEEELKGRAGGWSRLDLPCFTLQPAVQYLHSNADNNVTVLIGFPSSRTEAAEILAPIVCSLLHTNLFDAMRTVSHLIYNLTVDNHKNVCGGFVRIQYDVLDANLKKSWDIIVKTLKHYHKHRFSEKVVTGVKQFYRRNHNEVSRFTSNYAFQLLHQAPDVPPVLLSRAEKLRLVERSTAAQITDVFRTIFPLDQAVAVYKGPNKRDIQW